MCLLVISVFFVCAAMAQGMVYESVPDCLDDRNTTMVRTSCPKWVCNCMLCTKNDPLSKDQYCVYATNTTMFMDNTTWYCPDFDQKNVTVCADRNRAVVIALTVLYCALGGCCVLLFVGLVLRKICLLGRGGYSYV
jgi:hypothetical protein